MEGTIRITRLWKNRYSEGNTYLSESYVEHLEKVIESHRYNVKYFKELSNQYPLNHYYINLIKTNNDMVRIYEKELREHLQRHGREEMKVIKGGK